MIVINGKEIETDAEGYLAQLDDWSEDIASYLAQMPTKGLAYTKQVLSMSFTTSFEEQLHDEDIFQQKAAQTADYKEGANAFLEKRKPVFKGE
mgnify:CR=1 FL=1